MADAGDSSAVKPKDNEDANETVNQSIMLHTIDTDHDSFSRPGAQLASKQTFTSKSGESISGYPVIVDLRRLLQLTVGLSSDSLKEHGIIPGISNRDLLHAVVGLYDVSLSDMTPDVLYSTVCEKWARTIILVRDLKETIEDLEKRRKREPQEADEDDDDEEGCTESGKGSELSGDDKGSELSGDEDVYEEDEEQPSKFCDVFSDTDSEEEDEEDEWEDEEGESCTDSSTGSSELTSTSSTITEDDDEEDFSKGINSFISCVVERRKARKSCDGSITEEMVGVENRIIACATFEKKFVEVFKYLDEGDSKHKDRVIHLTLVSVRRRCRKFGIGKYLLSEIVDPKVVGHYDAVVVHADNAAVEFFQKFGFSDDIVLNSRWKELAEQFTNCTLMCYLPGFSGHRLLSSIRVPGLEMFELEQELLKWKEKTLEVYQQQVTCMMRMKHEVLQLKYTTSTQDTFLKALVEENETLKTQKMEAEKDLLDYRLLTAKSTFSQDDSSKQDQEDNISTQELIDNLQRQVDKMDLKLKHKRTSSKDLIVALTNKPSGSCTVIDESRYMAFSQQAGKGEEEPYDHIKDSAFFYDVTEQFKQQMLLDKTTSCNKCEVSTVSKALVPEKFKKLYRAKIQSMKDPLMVLDLYFCGTLEHPERIKDILKQGFSESEFSHGEYGHGLYFSKFPSKAAQFSKLGSLLKVEVGIGCVETVVREDRTRAAPAPGHDSIITPGRLAHMLGQSDATMNQEYVVFDVNQVLPLCLLTYETS